MEFRTGFVGIVGPTNAGKSTLMNGLIGQKISIVSAKTQTTYHGIRGVVNRPSSQIILVDTPGFQNVQDGVARLLNRVADKNAEECDLLVWVFDVSGRGFRRQIDVLRERVGALNRKQKGLCILNKVDQVPKPTLLPLLQELHGWDLFAEIIPISALKDKKFETLLNAIEGRLPEAQALFPMDMMTDRNEQFLVSELIREKIYAATHQEVPYATWVEIESWEEQKPCPVISARIHVDTDSKQGILIGEKGERLKNIGIAARKEIETLVGRQVCLKLRVDVRRDWKRDRNFVNRYLELT